MSHESTGKDLRNPVRPSYPLEGSRPLEEEEESWFKEEMERKAEKKKLNKIRYQEMDE